MTRIRLLLCFIFVCLSFYGKAQSYIGIAGGGGLTSEVGLRAATIAEFKVNSFLSFQPEFTYVQRTNQEIIRRLNPNRDYRQVIIDYFEIPLLAKFQVSVNSFRVVALMGPKVSYGMNMKANFVTENRITSEKISFEERGIDRFDVGLNLGVGIDKTISKNRKIFIDIRYYLGIYDIDTWEDSEIFNQGPVVNLGFLIPVFKAKNE